MTVGGLGVTDGWPFRADSFRALTPAVTNAIPQYPRAQGVLETSATTSLEPLWSMEPILYSRIPCVQGREVSLDQSDVSVANTEDVPSLIKSTAGHGANRGVHARSIAARCEDSDSLHRPSSLGERTVCAVISLGAVSYRARIACATESATSRGLSVSTPASTFRR